MTEKELLLKQVVNKEIIINASPSKVWDALTIPELMRQWMSETNIEVITDWKPGNPFIIRGDWYKAGFENKGTVLAYEEMRVLAYSHLSSLSRLPDTAENYSILEFRLHPKEVQVVVHEDTGHGTVVTFTASNFPTDAIYRHFVFYWNVAIETLKKFVEQHQL